MAHREVPSTEAAGLTGHQIVDVREPDEVAGGTLPGAVNIPLGELPERLDEIDRSRPVALLCRSGARSGRAAEFLDAQGYLDVVNLAGGMLAVQDAEQG